MMTSVPSLPATSFSQAETEAPVRLPSRAEALWFGFRAAGLQLRRLLVDLGRRVRRWPRGEALAGAPVLAEVRTPLWADGRAEEEFALVAGKVHNLRLAVRAFDGVEIPEGEVLSFWHQLGRVTARRGFVLGREVREGCVVPTLGGGLCQLSNALATCAVRAGLVLVERHGHTRRIEAGEAAAPDAIDATVFWNYVDLRVRAPQAWRIEVELTRHALVMRLRGWQPVVAPGRVAQAAAQPMTWHRARPGAANPAPAPVARGCLTCNETQCFRHRDHSALAGQSGRSAWLLDTWTPEFERHLQGQTEERDVLVPRAPQWRRWRVPGRTPWRVDAPHHVAWGVFLRRAISARWARGDGAGGPSSRRQARVLRGQAWLAADYARRLKPHHTHLVVDQALLPYLWREGVLGGRRFEVLMHSLPMTELQRRLDEAGRRWPQDQSLGDFRVDPALARAEAEALHQAERLVTPHREVARVLQAAGMSTVHCLEWQLPDAPTIGALMAPIAETAAPCIVLGASALGRKGVNELAQALQGHACEVWVLGSPAADPRVWGSLTVRGSAYGSDWPRHASALVLPAHVEHAPRAALRALANGVPVIATPACGLEGLPGVITVPPGDVPALLAALQPWLRTGGGRP